MTDGQTLKVREVAEIMRRPRQTINTWLYCGCFPGAAKAGDGKSSPYLIPIAEVRAFIGRRRSHLSEQLEILDAAIADLDRIER